MVLPSNLPDVDEIFEVYRLGIEFQKTVFHRYWPGFDRNLLIKEIEEGRHWKIEDNNRIACVFSVQYEDPIVWEDGEPSLYLHRIVTNPAFKGNGYVKEIIEWSKDHGKSLGKKYVRLDTFSDNPRLIDYYVRCGFRLIGYKFFKPEAPIPEHYKDGLSLFEMTIV
jgi:RimJ/RimL family protein N-acetyltransferase